MEMIKSKCYSVAKKDFLFKMNENGHSRIALVTFSSKGPGNHDVVSWTLQNGFLLK